MKSNVPFYTGNACWIEQLYKLVEKSNNVYNKPTTTYAQTDTLIYIYI